MIDADYIDGHELVRIEVKEELEHADLVKIALFSHPNADVLKVNLDCGASTLVSTAIEMLINDPKQKEALRHLQIAYLSLKG